jgi:hypothetical protein
LTIRVSPNRARIQVLLPVPRGPNRDKAPRSELSERGDLATELTVNLVSLAPDDLVAYHPARAGV